MNDVGIFFDEVERFVVNRFGDDAKSECFANFRENLQARLAKSLKTVRRGARLVGAATKKADASWLEPLGYGHALRFGFDGTGSGNQRKMNAANEHVTGRRGNPDHRVFFFGLSADQFVGLADRNALCDAGQGFEDAEIDLVRDGFVYRYEHDMDVDGLPSGEGVFLLAACINLASGILARGTARLGELTVRSALGATRVRLARQLLTGYAGPAISEKFR